MRAPLVVLPMCAVLGGCILAACSTGPVPRVASLPTGDASTVAQAIRCLPLPASEPVSVITDGSREVKLRYPEKDPVAVLTVPRGAVDQPTTFRLSAPAGTQRVLVDATATNAAGALVTNFQAVPLRLVLNLRDGCTPRRPTSADSTFFAYRFALADSTFDERGGKWDDARFWEILWQKTAKMVADLDHLSGYILAQGRRPPGD